MSSFTPVYFPVTYSVVVAVYNSGPTLEALTLRLNEVFRNRLQATFELVFVNDGSSNPETLQVLEKLQTQHPEVKVVQLTRNFGQHAATLCGIGFARGKFVLTLDDDLQHLPEEIPALTALQHHDVVVASFNAPQQPWQQQLGSKLKAWLDGKLFDKPATVKFSSFRLLSRPVADHLAKCQVPYPYLPALLLQVTSDVVMAPVKHAPRASGTSGYTFSKQLSIILSMLFNHSTLPLRFISWWGMLMAGLSFIAMLFFAFRKICGQVNTTGWTSLIVTLLFIGGLLLLAIGILGEYLGRTLAGVEKKPMYIVRKTAGFEQN